MGAKNEMSERDKADSFVEFLVVLAAALYVFLLVFKLPFTPFLNEVDHHMFLYEGMRLLDGDTMYRDFFQFTFPGSQTWYWLMFSIFGLKYWILPATIVAIATASAWICVRVSRAVIGGGFFVLPTVFFIFFGFRWNGLDGTHRMFSPVFLMLAVFVLLKGTDAVRLVFAGIFCAVASFFTQQRGVFVVATIAVFLIVEGFYSGRKRRSIIGSLSALGVSFVVTLTALCSYFVISAGVANFCAATIEYPAKYYHYAVYNNFGILALDLKSSLNISDFSSALTAVDSLFYLFVIPVAYLVFWLLFFVKRKTHEWTFWRPIFLIALVGTSLTFTITAPNTSRLFQIAMPGLIVFTWLIDYAKKTSKGSPLATQTARAVAALFFLLTIIQVIRVQTNPYQMLETPSGILAYNPSPIIDKRYKWLMERTKPGDYVFESYQPYIYFPLLLRNPTKYGQIWDSDYTRPEHVTETIADLEARRPQYILWNNDYNKPSAMRTAGDHTAPLADYLQQNYKPAGDIIENSEGHIQIWKHTN